MASQPVPTITHPELVAGSPSTITQTALPVSQTGSVGAIEIEDPEIASVLEGANWSAPEAPNKYYIKETAPIFTELGKYFSTDNFIKRIPGYDPKKEFTHYGDPGKQMEFVQRQMVELTGLMSLDERLDSVAQMKKLYDAGVEFGSALRLSPGVTLTPEMVAKIQDDMVWPEITNINGVEVLLPRFYAATSKRGEKASGLLAQNNRLFVNL